MESRSCLIDLSNKTPSAQDEAGKDLAHSRDSRARPPLRSGRRSGGAARKSLKFCVGAVVGAGIIVMLGAALIFARLSFGPMGLNALSPYIQRALVDKLGKNYVVKLGGSTVEFGDAGPSLAIDGLSLASAAGQSILQAPKAEVSVDPFALIVGSVRPTSVKLYDVALRLVLLPDGSAAIAVAGNQPVALSSLLNSAAPVENAVAAKGPPPALPSLSNSPAPMARIEAALERALDAAADPKGPMGALRKVSVARGRLVFEDRANNQTIAFNGLDLAFEKTRSGSKFTLSADGPNGRWTVGAAENGAPGQARTLDVSAKGLSTDEISIGAGRSDLGFDLDSAISAQAQVRLTAQGAISDASGNVAVGPGFFHLHDPDDEPMAIRDAVGEFRWNSTRDRVDVNGLRFDETNGSHFELAGSVSPPEKAGGLWVAAFAKSGPSVIGGDRPQEKPIPIDELTLSGSYLGSSGRLAVDKFTLRGRDLNVSASGSVGGDPNGPQVAVKVAVTQTKIKGVLRVWPTFIAAAPRSWLIDHLEGGVLRTGAMTLALSGHDLELLKRHHAPADADAQLHFSVANASLSFIPGVPALSDLNGNGSITGRTISFQASSGAFYGTGGRKLALAAGAFVVPDSDPKPAPATVTARLVGGLDAVADVLGRDGLKPYGGGVPIDTTLLSGQVDAQLTINTKLGKFTTPSDTNVSASAKVSDFAIAKLIGKQRIDQADLAVSVDAGGLRATGQGRLLGSVATISLDRPAGPSSVTQAVVSVSLDDAARAKLGFGAPGLTGPVNFRFASTLGQTEAAGAQVDLDLTRAAIDGLVPGYSKSSGRPAKASFQIVQGPTGVEINQFVFDAGASLARGNFRLDSAGALQDVHLSQIRLSPGDDMSADAVQTKDGLKVEMHGAVFDARPFLHSLSATDPDSSGSPGKSFDLAVKSALVTGANREAVSNLTLRIVKRDGVLRQFQLAGNLGGSALVGTIIRQAPGQVPQISVTTAAAGRLLSFIDLYKRVEGGVLSLAMAVDDNSVAGRLTIQNFVVRNEPGLRRIVSEGVAQERSDPSRIDTNAARFTKLQVDFSRRNGRIVLRDGSMFGPQIGTTLEGWLDFPRNQVSLSGTFVPAYGLNNLFSQIPIFGLILGGGAHEGLFGVNFRISGSPSAPVLTINPLSAIAPGFLRKVFGALDNVGHPAPGQ